MYRIGQRVGGNTWAKEHDMLLDNTPCYFVRCAGANGGRWHSGE